MFNDFGGLDELGDVQYDDHWDFGRLSSKIRYSSSAPKVLIEHSGVSLQALKRFHLIVIYSSMSSGNETAKADRVGNDKYQSSQRGRSPAYQVYYYRTSGP